MRLYLLAPALLGFLLAAAPSQAAPIVVDWASSAPSTDIGLYDFNNGTIMGFTPFVSDELTLISGPGYAHNHSGSTQTINLEILLDGVWTQLGTQTWANNSGDQSLAIAFGTLPFSFPAGIVSGLRLTSSPGSNQTYHNLNGTTFTFNQTTVPEPASVAIWGAFAVVGLVARRRRLSH